ncbi:PBPRA1643 family SWIM/SEC-C metal-binding motif protein [Shewanella psychrotolerans]|uniref:PBPRA1643 family SWIM/SEC-C metal-binding motif protein n=1 Tax=Shewanella psychrotolerans TaxID=2864206 RepID=UPI001C658A1C|nr:PBPRA1643 family SWIM/SEC-C metal-binding motif protein [Shewanella psychrotolerans]QYK02386.1 SEC-C domain-containing protein [Shewanella psychrotolerans]
MSDKFFFKGRKTPKPKHESYGYNTKRTTKLGSEAFPLQLVVPNETRKHQVEAIVTEHQLFADIVINEKAQEDIVQLEGILNRPKTATVVKQPQRNEPCPCGSDKKYKKCCGK